MKYFFLFFLFASCSSYGMQAPSHNDSTEKFIQKCTDKIAASNPDISLKTFTDSFNKVKLNNPDLFRGYSRLFNLIATDLNNAIGLGRNNFTATATTICAQTFQELSGEEREELIRHLKT
jgi:hypothetical protein